MATGTTTVALDRPAYELLKRAKHSGESFSDVVKRLARPRRPITDFIGIWTEIPAREFRQMEKDRRARKQAGRERMDRLVRSFQE
jgi:predicted CopG family antitoxin